MRPLTPSVPYASLRQPLAHLVTLLMLTLLLHCHGGSTPETTAPQTAVSSPSPLVARYSEVATRIGDAMKDSGRAYALLGELTDDIGARISGSVALDRALSWAEQHLREAGHTHVAIEPVDVEHWVRGNESLELIEPHQKSLSLLGLGGSIGTGPEGLTAEVVVVHSPEELTAHGEAAKGKIVLFDVPMPPYDPKTGNPGYGKVVGIRIDAARMAAKVGAIAALVRSLTANSLGVPHAGAMRCEDAAVRIPAAAISVEDATLLTRLAEKGHKPIVKLMMEASSQGTARSGNVVAQLDGREHPKQIVVIGGHIDSWDVGQGAHDDGAGVVAAMEALNLLRRLKLVPRRSIRVVLWTDEESGLAGAKQYALDHRSELGQHVAGIESDTGGAPVVALAIEVEDKAKLTKARDRLTTLLPLLEPFKVQRVLEGFSGADLEPLRAAGIPGIGLVHDLSHYFDYHHSEADTLDKIDSTALDQSVAVLALTAYILADMPDTLL